MYVSDPVVTLIYDSGKTYVASLELSTAKIRLFWEDDDADDESIPEPKEHDQHYQCFTVFDATNEDGDYYSLDELVERTHSTITAHKLEPEDGLAETHEHERTDYPPEH